jgi:hypothetical protein
VAYRVRKRVPNFGLGHRSTNQFAGIQRTRPPPFFCTTMYLSDRNESWSRGARYTLEDEFSNTRKGMPRVDLN